MKKCPDRIDSVRYVSLRIVVRFLFQKFIFPSMETAPNNSVKGQVEEALAALRSCRMVPVNKVGSLVEIAVSNRRVQICKTDVWTNVAEQQPHE